ncbi:hypothetical protein LXL04_037691 [Taraxacum kok-saghyz]
MKISSRSILSPARARDPPPISLSNSRSRKLRNSRSIKGGGASPAMFPTTTGKRRGSGFENPEPSSPKVTCIGQVRVKSKKKQAKNLRCLSRRDVSFRRLEHSGNGFGSQRENTGSNYQQGGNQECLQLQRNNNQRWVHLPLTICETLRTFGSEVSCLFPCRNSCSSTTAMDKEENKVGESVGGENRQGSCGLFARWLVALQEGDEAGGRDATDGGGGGREDELVAGDDDGEMGIRNSRRHVFQDLEIVNDSVLGSIDEARVSTCVPPKNALLLIRCRSDPMKMEALTNRFWEPNMVKNEEEDEDEESFNNKQSKIPEHLDEEEEEEEEEETHMGMTDVSNQEHDDLQENAIEHEQNREMETNPEIEMEKRVQEEEVETNPEMERKQSIEEEDDKKQSIETNEEKEEEEEEEESMFLWSLFEENTNQLQEEEQNSEIEDAQRQLSEDEDVQEPDASESNYTEKIKDYEQQNVKIDSSKSLPECLLLMMYEPKLSMEVSKETWVCSTDFIRHRSSRKPPPVPPPIKPNDGQDESGRQQGLLQPARSSMASKFDQKLADRNGYEPLVLTRCKSDPMEAKMGPDSCFWKNKLEPPRRASFGVDVAGFGF